MKKQDINIVAKDYSKYLTNINLETKLESVNKSIDDMLARLEEFETMFALVEPDIKDSKDILKSIGLYKPEFENLCEKIDGVEFLVAHIRANLDTLEERIEEGEAKMGAADAGSSVAEKVTNMLTPLFKKASERKGTANNVNLGMEMFKTEQYFKE